MRFLVLSFVIACGSPKPAEQPSNEAPAADKPASDSERVREAEQARKKAEAEAAEAVKQAEEVVVRLEKLTADLDALDRRLTEAVDSVIAAQNDADRAAAKAKLEALRKEKAEMEARIAEAKAAAARAQRLKGRTISKQCQDNPLAKGCE